MWKKTSEVKTVTRDELFVALYKNFEVLPDWHVADHDEGFVTILFYVDEEDEDDE